MHNTANYPKALLAFTGHAVGARKVLLASILTVVVLAYLNEIGLPYFMVAPLPTGSWLTPALLLNIIGGIPAMILLRHFKIPYAVPMTLLAIICTHWALPHLQLAFLPEYSSELSWAVIAQGFSYVIFTLLYILSYALFNVWTANYKYKFAAAAAALVATYFATRSSY